MLTQLFREVRTADRAHKASNQESPDEILRMLESGMKGGWSDKALSHVVLGMRRHAGDERVAQRLERLVASSCGSYLRRAVAVALGDSSTASGRRTLRALIDDPDKAVAKHAEMSLERMRKNARSPLG